MNSEQNGFEDGASRVAGLSERQREVLAMIAAGRTNPEIAEALGLTFWGARWHVSEILSKLGVESREEAAECWRRSRGVARRFRSWVALPLALPKAITTAIPAAAALAAVVAIAIGVAPWRASTAPDPDTPFWMESEALEANRVVVYRPGAAPEVQTQELRGERTWSYGDRSHSWSESWALAEGREFRTMEAIADGEALWTRPAGVETSRSPLPRQPRGLGAFSNGADLGPLLDSSLESLLARLSSETGTAATIVGRETVLGRETVIVEYGPTSWTRVQSGWATGTTRLWVDAARMFVMQSEARRGDGGWARATVTVLRYGEPQDASRFTAPAGD